MFPGGSTDQRAASWASRGYHIEFGAASGCRLRTAAGIEWLTGGSYGAKFKQDVRRYYGRSSISTGAAK